MRNEESYKRRPYLHTLQDHELPIMWALATSPGAQVLYEENGEVIWDDGLDDDAGNINGGDLENSDAKLDNSSDNDTIEED